MNANKIILKIWLLFVHFEKSTQREFMDLSRDKLQPSNP